MFFGRGCRNLATPLERLRQGCAGSCEPSLPSIVRLRLRPCLTSTRSIPTPTKKVDGESSTFFGRGCRNRTYTNGFGDRSTTIIRTPLVLGDAFEIIPYLVSLCSVCFLSHLQYLIITKRFGVSFLFFRD